MEKDRESLVSKFPFDRRAPNFNSMSLGVNLGKQLNIDMDIPNGTFSTVPFSEMHQQQVNNVVEPHGWFYCLPRFRQSVTTIQSSPIFKENLLVEANGNGKEVVIPTFGSGNSHKSFLVFDQTGDQTTLIFSSEKPVKCPSSWSPKLPSACNMIERELTKREPTNFLEDELNEDCGTDIGSEMHEDTEELNALLYSDGDSDYTDDVIEVTSKMTFHEQHLEESEEVASCNGVTRSLPLSLIDTGNSSKRKRDYEDDDAHSSCGDVKYPCEYETDISSDELKTKSERIRETVKILQRIIPDGKGKNAVDVLDEAILYLNSLKLKAKTLGLDSLRL